MIRKRDALIVGTVATVLAGWSIGSEPVVKLVTPRRTNDHQPVVGGPLELRPPIQTDASGSSEKAHRSSTPVDGRPSAFVPRFQQLAPVAEPEDADAWRESVKTATDSRLPGQNQIAPANPTPKTTSLPPVIDLEEIAPPNKSTKPATPFNAPRRNRSSPAKSTSKTSKLPPVVDAHEYRLHQRPENASSLAEELARVRQGSQIRALRKSVGVPQTAIRSANTHPTEAGLPPIVSPGNAKINRQVPQTRSGSGPLAGLARKPSTPVRPIARKTVQERPSDLPVGGDDRMLGFPKFEREFQPIGKLSTNILPPKGKLPPDLARVEFLEAGAIFQPLGASRDWVLRNYAWVAPGTYHWPLYFEEENLERYGYHAGCLQPLLSGAHFFGRLPLLPYMNGAWPCHECIYTLGHYRPGDCVPYRCSRLPWSLRGAIYEAGAAAGLVYLIP